MKNIWFISDTHFNHANIIKYCNRPYKDVQEMNNSIIQRWNSCVERDDIVWFLGDFVFFKKSDLEQQDYVKRIVHSLNGNIYFLMGNHDRRISRHPSYWYQFGFRKVYDYPVVWMDHYILSHAPFNTEPFKNIHGHIRNSYPELDVTKNSFNVSVEVIDFKPILFEEIVSSMLKGEQLNEGKERNREVGI